MPRNHHGIDYVELVTDDLDRSKDFYGNVFGWTFVDYGPEYASFERAGVDGGFRVVDAEEFVAGDNPLIVLYSSDLEATQQRVLDAGGTITQAIFSFPGGRRFHFRDPRGNGLAVWSEPVDES